MIIAVTGSTGLVGSALVTALEAREHLVRRLVRHEVCDADREIRWNPDAGEIDAAELNGVDAVVHLAGENIAGGRWNEELQAPHSRKSHQGHAALGRNARRARAEAQRAGERVGHRLLRQPRRRRGRRARRPRATVSSPTSAASGKPPPNRLTTPTSASSIFASAWCSAPTAAALAKMLPPFKLGLGGVIGTGRQYFSWIALDDLVSAIVFALETESLVGPVNAVAPSAVTNREFTKTLGRVLGRPTIFPMPAFAARLAFGEMADEMLLGGVRVAPHELTAAEFEFAYPQLEPALRHLARQVVARQCPLVGLPAMPVLRPIPPIGRSGRPGKLICLAKVTAFAVAVGDWRPIGRFARARTRLG